jgi:hypothetical protein
MSSPVDLDSIERKAYTTKFRDGLYDLQLGILLLGGWFLMRTDIPRESEAYVTALSLYALFCALTCLIPWLGRRWITARRVGTMKPGPARRAKIRKAGWFLALIVVIQAFLVLLQTMGIVQFDISRLLIASLAGFIVFLPMAVIAYRNDFFRSYLHAFLVGLAVFLLILLDSITPLFWAGAVITSMGIVIFIRFLIVNPLPREPMTGDTSEHPDREEV